VSTQNLHTQTVPLTNLSFNAQPLTILVGKSEGKFFVHQPHICASSKFFEKACSDEHKAPTDSTIKLLNANAKAFEVYLKWLYSGRFYIIAEGDVAKDATSDNEWTKWNECYKLSSFLEDTDFADALIDMAIDKMSSDLAYYVEIATIIYQHSAPRSRHRKFAVDLAVHLWDDDDFKDLPKQNAPTEFLTDLLRTVGFKMRREAVMVEDVDQYFEDLGEYDDPCKYHEHRRGKGLCHKEKREFVFEQPA
jgi:hypothetical protein